MVVIPELQDGVLPQGVHECTLDEIERSFGQFRRTDRRSQLLKKLRTYVETARQSGIAVAVVVNGSSSRAKDF